MNRKSHQILQVNVIEYSTISNAIALMRGCHHLSGLYHEPDGLLITGKDGTGKSTLVAHYLRKVLLKKGVLAMVMPSSASSQKIINIILAKLGYCSEKKMTMSKSSYLVEVLKEKEIGLLIIDEFHLIIDSNQNMISPEIQDLLSEIQMQAKVAIVALGTPVCEMIVRQNPRLARLFSFHFELQSFSHNKEFIKFLKKLNTQLPVEISSHLIEDDFLNQLINVTDGLISKIIQFFITATDIAIAKEKNKIEYEEFTEAFDIISSLNDKKKNPLNNTEYG
ncbi:TniB family NTP-binding protein [Bacillus cereus]|uniref:TniB family NTP-binding protein n=1 Tax=Bacillus cereus TaxID=1396 RepID=UPI000BF96353|nr:TniB family NTP-binding protein [Bacillus cereus]PFN68723.1 hypothetical protein COJ59_14375 [Bacillus cereus]